MQEPTIHSMFVSGSDVNMASDLDLAAQFAPIIIFDKAEPFLPSAMGVTVFRENGRSPSFPRDIELQTPTYSATTVIEYAIWWDWEIEHLYELEHLWVYLGTIGNDENCVVHAVGSFHGLYHDLLPMKYELVEYGLADLQAFSSRSRPYPKPRIVVYSEPGKHAFVPDKTWFESRREETLKACRFPGKGGLHVTDLFKDKITEKNEAVDAKVKAYLQKLAFEPTYKFTRAFFPKRELMVPWPVLEAWIPQRMAWWVEQVMAED